MYEARGSGAAGGPRRHERFLARPLEQLQVRLLVHHALLQHMLLHLQKERVVVDLNAVVADVRGAAADVPSDAGRPRRLSASARKHRPAPRGREGDDDKMDGLPPSS